MTSTFITFFANMSIFAGNCHKIRFKSAKPVHSHYFCRNIHLSLTKANFCILGKSWPKQGWDRHLWHLPDGIQVNADWSRAVLWHHRTVIWCQKVTFSQISNLTKLLVHVKSRVFKKPKNANISSIECLVKKLQKQMRNCDKICDMWDSLLKFFVWIPWCLIYLATKNQLDWSILTILQPSKVLTLFAIFYYFNINEIMLYLYLFNCFIKLWYLLL